MADVALRVNGQEYAGWKSARVTRGIEAVAGGFELSVSDRWAGSAAWQIVEEDECTLALGGEVVLTGYVDRREAVIDAGAHSLTVAGRDRAGALVDCSAVLTKWEFLNTPLLTFAKRVCAPFNVSVSLQSGLTAPRAAGKLSIDPGDSAFDALERACRLAGVLPVSDGRGGLVLTRTGSSRCTTALVEGENLKAASVSVDASGRFARYVVRGQQGGTDALFGEQAAAVQATARDAGVRRSERVLLVRPEGPVTVAQAKTRAEWEATVRAARGVTVTATVQGWAQASGALWPVNALVKVVSPTLGLDGEFLVTSATYSLDDSTGTTTELTLRMPGAFTPEPVVPATRADPLSALLGG